MELTAALAAFAVALLNFAAVELRIRATRRAADELAARVTDVQRQVGADRRRTD